MDALESGPLHRFADWPNAAVPSAAAGVYTVWDGDRFIYVGMAGRGRTAADLEARRAAGKRTGLWERLGSHASGRRSGDQFNVYVCDRFVVPSLTLAEQERIGTGELLLDQMTREYIRGRLSYRFLETPDGRSALRLEAEVQRGALAAGMPYLNPGVRQ